TAALAGVRPGPARIPVISAVTGEPVAGEQLDARYWYDSLRSPVRFGQAITTLARSGYRAFIEISPHPVLTAAITATLEQEEPAEPGHGTGAGAGAAGVQAGGAGVAGVEAGGAGAARAAGVEAGLPVVVAGTLRREEGGAA